MTRPPPPWRPEPPEYFRHPGGFLSPLRPPDPTDVARIAALLGVDGDDAFARALTMACRDLWRRILMEARDKAAPRAASYALIAADPVAAGGRPGVRQVDLATLRIQAREAGVDPDGPEGLAWLETAATERSTWRFARGAPRNLFVLIFAHHVLDAAIAAGASAEVLRIGATADAEARTTGILPACSLALSLAVAAGSDAVDNPGTLLSEWERAQARRRIEVLRKTTARVIHKKLQMAIAAT